ncbi:hypothetical protein ACN6LI_002792 [Streptomyces violaceoruber]
MPRPTQSSSAASPITAVRRQPPTSEPNAGPSDTSGSRPTPGPMVRSTTATTAMAATGVQESTTGPDGDFFTVMTTPVSQRSRAASSLSSGALPSLSP